MGSRKKKKKTGSEKEAFLQADELCTNYSRGWFQVVAERMDG